MKACGPFKGGNRSLRVRDRFHKFLSHQSEKQDDSTFRGDVLIEIESLILREELCYELNYLIRSCVLGLLNHAVSRKIKVVESA